MTIIKKYRGDISPLFIDIVFRSCLLLGRELL